MRVLENYVIDGDGHKHANTEECSVSIVSRDTIRPKGVTSELA